MQAKINAVYMGAVSGEKNGRKYNLLQLSDGRRTATSFLNEALDTTGLKEGDEVEVTFTLEIGNRNEWTIVPVKIEAV